jgi:hypothetical protein
MVLADPKYSDGISPIADFWIGYNASTNWVTLYADGSITTGSGQTKIKPGGKPIKGLMKIGGVTRMVLIEGGDDKLYVVGEAGRLVGTYTLPNSNINESVFGTPGGVRMTKIAGISGNYDAGVIMLLGSDKKLYISGTSSNPLFVDPAFPSGGTNAAPVKLTGAANTHDWKDLSTLASSYQRGSMTALTTTGDLWATGGDNVLDLADTAVVPFQFISSNCVSCGVGAYGKPEWYVLKDDGFAWGTAGGKTLTKCNLGTLVPVGWQSLGGLPGALNVTSVPSLMIIPT